MEKHLLLFQMASLHCDGIHDNEQLGAMLSALNTGHILIESEAESPLGAKTILNTLDCEGNVLVAGENYMLKGNKVKVLREEFGAGNFMDTYYRVFYLDSDLTEKWLIVDVWFKGGPFGTREYRSRFQPIKEDEKENKE